MAVSRSFCLSVTPFSDPLWFSSPDLRLKGHILTGGVVTRDVLTKSHQLLNLSFDPTGKMLLIPTCVGIKLINWESNKLITVVGKKDASTLRFDHICLCSGDAKVNRQMQLARSGGSSATIDHDETKEE